jgi:hypothetical protein
MTTTTHTYTHTTTTTAAATATTHQVGEFGKRAEQWTPRLRQLLDPGTKGDGTFWMSYDDFLARFYELDVCKAHRGWYAATFGGSTLVKAPSDMIAVPNNGVVQVCDE